MSNPVDTKIISKLAEILDKTNLTELEYEDEGCRICLTRDFSARTAPAAYVPAPAAPAAAAPAVSAAPVQAVVETAAETDYSKNPGCVKSPMVGVVYLSADPNTPNYVKAGDNVSEGDIVCLIEAMKTFNPIKSDKDGVVKEILVTDGAAVEFDQPLIVIE